MRENKRQHQEYIHSGQTKDTPVGFGHRPSARLRPEVLISLIASGISSSVVGTMAGQLIMQGFLHIRLPIWLRRAVTMIPAFAVVAMGVNATQALVISQVILSIALPVPMIALIIFSGRADIMGNFRIGRLVQALAIFGAAVVLSLNFVLLAQFFGVPVPGLTAG